MDAITNTTVIVAAYFPVGNNGFWVRHRCIKSREGKKSRCLCEDCEKNIFPRTSQFLDEYWCIKEVKPDHEFAHPVYSCTDNFQVIIPCIERYPNHLPDVSHKRCVVDTSSYSGYTKVRCLDCGNESVLAFNSFSVAGNDDHDKQVARCCVQKGAGQ